MEILNISGYRETDEYKYSTAISYTLTAVSVPGLLANIILIVVSFRPNITGSYKLSVLNLALIDLTYSMNNILSGKVLLSINLLYNSGRY